MATITSLGFNITSNWDGAGVTEARNDLMRLQEDMRRISGASLRINVDMDTARARAEIDELRASVNDIHVGLDLDNAEIMDTESVLDSLTRDRTVDVRMDNHNMTGELEAMARGFDSAGGSATAFGGQASSAGSMATIAIAAVSAALVALPGVITLVGAALMTGLAGSVVAAGALILHNDEQIKAGWESLKNDGIQIFKEAAAPMRDEFVGALGMIHDRLIELKPALIDVFGSAAPLIKPMTSALLDMATNALPGIQEAMHNMGPVIEGLRQGMANFGTSISNMFSGMSAGAAGMGAILNSTFTQIGILMQNFGVAAGQMAGKAAQLWDGLLTGINSLLKGLLDGLNGFLQQAGGPLTELLKTLGSQLGDSLRQLLPVLGQFVGILADTLVPALNALLPPLTEFIKSAMTGLMPVVKALSPLIVALADGFGTILHWLSPAAPVITGVAIAWWALNAAMAANPITLVVIAIAALASGIVYLATKTQFFQTIWNTVWGAVKSFGEAIWNGLRTALSAFTDFITQRWQQFTGTISNAWNTLWNGAKQLVDTVWGNIKQSWSTLINGLKQVWDTVSGALRAAWDAYWNAIKTVVEGIWNAIKGSWQTTIDGMRNVWNAGSGALKSAWEGAWNGIKAVGQGIWDAIKAAWQFHVDGVRQIWDIFSNALRAAWDAFWNAIKAAGEGIWNAIKASWNAFTDGVRAVWDAFSGALRAAWDNFWNAVKAAGEAIWNAIKASWQAFSDGCRAIWDAFSNALRSAWESFWNLVKSIAEGIWNAIKSSWQGLWDALTAAWNTFRDFFENAWSTCWNTVKSVAQSVWNELTSDFEDVKNKVTDTIQTMVDKVEEIWNKITGIFKKPVDDVKGIWNGVAGVFGLPKFADGGAVQGHATGGAINGMGGGIGDKIPAFLSDNEHVLTSADVDAMGGQSSVYAFRQSLHQTGIEGRRVGRIQDDNPAAFASGGAVDRFDAAVSMAREKGDGRAYVYGGSGPDGFDCSGYMSAIYNVLTGRDPWGRSFSTESDFGSLGFTGGLTSRFAIGVHNGGGGPNSHMAGTLGGVNVESGGPHNSTLYGGAAAGANSGQFEHQYSLPEVGGQFVSGGPGGGSGGPTAEQIAAHDQAVAAIRQVINDTLMTTATMQHMIESGQIANMNRAASPDFIGPVSSTQLTPAAQNKYGMYAPAGDTHGAGTKGAGDGAIAKLDAALAAAHSALGGTIPDGDRRALLEHALSMTNTPPPNTLDSWLAGLNTLIQRESGWNAGAVNNWDSNAANGTPSKGLMQLIDPTFRANHQGGTSDDIFDPLANVSAGINYIKSRYGDISNVQQANANAAPQGYRTGTGSAASGWSLVGENGPEMVNFGGGEQVKTFEDIVSALKDTSLGTAKDLQEKISTDLKSFVEKLIQQAQSHNADMRSTLETEFRNLVSQLSGDLQGSGQQLANQVEDAITRVMSASGIQVNMPLQAPANGADVQQYAQQVASQLLPQLEMMIRQRVGAR